MRGIRRALSPTFPAGEMVFFIPWRVVAENPARRISTCSDRLGWPAAPSPIPFSDIPVRGDDGARAIGANDDAAAVEVRGQLRHDPIATVAGGVSPPCRSLRISGWRDGVLYPLAGGGRAPRRMMPQAGGHGAANSCLGNSVWQIRFARIGWRRRRHTEHGDYGVSVANTPIATTR